MPSPYGARRSAATYYQYGGVPQHYVVDWDGLPPGPTRAAETRALGCDDYIDIVANAHLRKSLGDYFPVSMSMESGRQSVLHSGPEQSHLYDTPLGIFGLSKNENRLAIGAAIGLAGYFAWKAYKKKRPR